MRTRRLALILALALSSCDGGSSPSAPPAGSTPFAATTPAGYWEGKVTTSETPMKDHARTLTRTVSGEMWFTVRWDAARDVGVAVGEVDATYGAVLTVKNLPKVTAPVPGGSVKFEPNVGGTLGDDNRRKIRVVGALAIDPATGKGTLLLEKADVPDTRTDAERLDGEASGAKPPDAPMEFTIRADPGVSGGFSGAAGGVSYAGGMVTGEAGGAELSSDAPDNPNLIVQRIPMKPFTPFDDAPGKVEKRPGGPFVASYEKKTDKLSVVWTAKQAGGESREPLSLTPEQQRLIDSLVERVRNRR